MRKPFRDRAKETLTSVINQRIFLIETNKSKNFITWDQCKALKQSISILRSDRQFAAYLLKHDDFFIHIIPGGQLRKIITIKSLIREARMILKEKTEVQLKLF